MTTAKVMLILKTEIYELMGSLSVEEIVLNRALILQIESVLRELSGANI